MRTAHVISQNFQTRHRVGLGFVAQQQISDFLVGIGSMCAWLDLDQSGKDRAGSIAQCVFVKQIAGGVRLEVVLERALIELLISTGNRDREHVTSGAAADHPADAFQTRIPPSEIEREIKY